MENFALRTPEHEPTRISVTLRNILLLFGVAFVVFFGGIIGLINKLIWGDLVFGVGIGLFLATGIVGLSAILVRGKSVPCIVEQDGPIARPL